MNRDIEIKVFDSCNNLPDSVWSEMTRELEKEFAVKWYVIFAYSRDEIVGFMRILWLLQKQKYCIKQQYLVS